MDSFITFSWSQTVQNTGLMLIAYLLALPIGIERERNTRSAGIRTFPLLAMAACGYSLIGFIVFDDHLAQSRVLEGIITAIGFLGGGAILKYTGSVSGTSTAAALWSTGTIGVAVAARHVDIAIFLSLATFCTLKFLGDAKPYINDKKPGQKPTDKNEE